MDIFSLFPKALGICNLNRDFTNSEIDYIKKLKYKTNTGNAVSEKTDILNSNEMSDIKKFVELSLESYFNTVYSPAYNTKLRITQSWVNYTSPGEFHHKHVHSNSLISGVLYIKADKNTDKIYFYRDGFQQLKTPNKEWNAFNSDSWWMEAKTGLMYIFPSSIPHSVEKITGNESRISLSFNTFPIGNFGNPENLSGLVL